MPRWISCQSFQMSQYRPPSSRTGVLGKRCSSLDRELAVEEAAQDGAPALGAEIDGEVLGHKALSCHVRSLATPANNSFERPSYSTEPI